MKPIINWAVSGWSTTACPCPCPSVHRSGSHSQLTKLYSLYTSKRWVMRVRISRWLALIEGPHACADPRLVWPESLSGTLSTFHGFFLFKFALCHSFQLKSYSCLLLWIWFNLMQRSLWSTSENHLLPLTWKQCAYILTGETH